MTAAMPPQPEGPLVFLADYGRDLFEMLKLALESEGYRVAWSPNGTEAFREIIMCRPDIVVGEMLLPEWEDGERLLLTLRADPRTRHIPLLVTSWSPEAVEHSVRWIEQLGIEVLRDPFDLDTFLDRVEFYVGPGLAHRAAA